MCVVVGLPIFAVVAVRFSQRGSLIDRVISVWFKNRRLPHTQAMESCTYDPHVHVSYMHVHVQFVILSKVFDTYLSVVTTRSPVWFSLWCSYKTFPIICSRNSS